MAPTTAAQLVSEIDRFEVRAKESAFTLYFLDYLFEGRDVKCRYLPETVLAITALLPALRNLLVHPWFSTPETTLFTPKQLDILSDNIRACGPLLEKVDKAVADANKRLGPGFKDESKENEEQFNSYPGDQGKAHGAVERCFRNLMVVLCAARAESLSRRGFLTDTEVFENLRLQDVLKNPERFLTPELAISHPLATPATAPASEPAPHMLPLPTTNVPTPPSAQPPSPPPHQSRDVIELQHPKGFRGRYGHPDYPLSIKATHVQLRPEDPQVHFDKSFEEAETERHRLSTEGRYPNVGHFGIWPPTFIAPNSIQDYQLKSIMSAGNKNEARDDLLPLPSPTTGSPVATPNTTRASTPAAKIDKYTIVGVNVTANHQAEIKQHNGEQKSTLNDKHGDGTSDPTATAAKAEPVPSSAPAEENVIKSLVTPLQNGMTALATPSEAIGTAQGSTRSTVDTKLDGSDQASRNPGLFQPATTPHLEAYILRPLCENVYDAVEWTYKVEQLPLDDEEIQVHVRKRGPAHSVIDDIRALHPEEIRVIRIRVKNRSGHLVSAQRGVPVDLVTKMGTFQVRPVIFVLKTSMSSDGEENSHALNGESIGLRPNLFGNHAPTAASFFGFGQPTTTTKVGGFGSNPTNPTGPGSFDNNQASASPFRRFGGFGSNPSQSTAGVFARKPEYTEPTRYAWMPKEPSNDKIAKFRQELQEKGESCTFAEKDPSGYSSINHFQCVTPLLSKDISFDELRIAETQADRMGRGKFGGFAGYPWDGIPSTASGFGQHVFLDKLKISDANASSGTTNSTSVVNSSAVPSSQLGGGGLFGGQQNEPPHGYQQYVDQSRPQPSGLFGTLQPNSGPNPVASNSFDMPPSSSGGLFGKPISTGSGGLFGGPKASAGGSFGQANKPAGLFGTKSGGGSFSQTQPGGLFRGASTAGGATGEGIICSMDQNTLPPSTSLFGTAHASPSAGGLFGQHHHGKTTDGGLFGSSKPQPYAPNSGLFGTTQPSSGGGLFGAATTQSINNSKPGSLFGNAQATSSSEPFRSAPAATSGSLFGKAQVTPASSLFAKLTYTPSSKGLFGAAQTGPSASSLSGAAPTSTGLFGGAQGSSFAQGASELKFGYTSGNDNNSGGSGLFSTGSQPASAQAPSLFASKPSNEQPKPSLFGEHSSNPPLPSLFAGAIKKEGGPSQSGRLGLAETKAPSVNVKISEPLASGPSSAETLRDTAPAPIASSLFGKFGSTAAPTTTVNAAQNAKTDTAPTKAGSYLTSPYCKTCSSDLYFHSQAEQQARVCHVCAGDTDPTCTMCRSTLASKNNAAESNPSKKDIFAAFADVSAALKAKDTPSSFAILPVASDPKNDASEGGVQLGEGATDATATDAATKKESGAEGKQPRVDDADE